MVMVIMKEASYNLEGLQQEAIRQLWERQLRLKKSNGKIFSFTSLTKE